MNYFALIAHMSLLIHMGSDVQEIVQAISQHKEKFPSIAEFSNFIKDAIGLLGSGIIGLPDGIVKQMTDALSALLASLAPAPAAS